jgi:hypothetical protein
LFDGRSELGEKRRRLLERSWAEVFRNHLLEDLPVDELFPYFDGAVKSRFTLCVSRSIFWHDYITR